MFKFKTVFLAAAVSLASAGVMASALPVMHSPSSGSNYVAYTDVKTFTQADSFCKSKQGHLAVYNSNGEITDLKKYLELVPGVYWLGATQSPSYAITTVTGQTFYTQTVGIPETSIANPNESSYYRFSADPLNVSSLQWAPAAIGSTGFVCEFEDSPV
ncbi:MAG: lectin-like protein [Methylovulum miyakonense]|uniref:lectin-like protein n=1 Tax=Methylovulum miyakonense TaxID=645578 RepID=UPI003BB6C7C4